MEEENGPLPAPAAGPSAERADEPAAELAPEEGEVEGEEAMVPGDATLEIFGFTKEPTALLMPR